MMLEIAEPPVEAVIVHSMDRMRAYYSDDEKIICASADGITPSEKISAPQAKQCAVCPQSSWGSRITPNGKRARACTEYATLKLLVLDEPNYALLRVPSTSLKSFRAALKGFLNEILDEFPAKFFTKSSIETSRVTLIPP